ncbi:N-acetylmuramoyl-L-alanine amidase [Pseudoduganella sp. GCM10020061]|uniref:N-acetylmuramoyl-L-alanine amidase n=1 Tax=Pseudoduganella sp. GCM10020061 TaxID=3317345 RepID=UPI003629D1C5
MKKLFAATLTTALLAGCTAPGPRIDTTYTAKSQSSRVKFVIVHYTVSNLPQSINILTNQVVSSHYLLTDEAKPTLYRLVDESRTSNHAGVSNWKNYSLLNPSSIGIEIVNPGFTMNPDGTRQWYPFPQAQMDILIPLLKDIVKRHNIEPNHILGHADIAPQRKQDPGPMFPWKQLADAGLIPWPDDAKVRELTAAYTPQVPEVLWFQKKLKAYGYTVPLTGELDQATRNVITTFQMKYRPVNIDGMPDAHTAAILDVMTPGDPTRPAPVPPPVQTTPVEQPPAGEIPAAQVPAVPVPPAQPVPPAPVPPAQPIPPAAPVPATPPVQETPPAPATPPAVQAPAVPTK